MPSHNLSKNIYPAKTRLVALYIAKVPYRLQIHDIFVDDQQDSITFS
jgi:hypothetical protein